LGSLGKLFGIFQNIHWYFEVIVERLLVRTRGEILDTFLIISGLRLAKLASEMFLTPVTFPGLSAFLFPDKVKLEMVAEERVRKVSTILESTD